ncbi:hypothetical protein [Tsukamurella tyrosinosolvens]|uniref:hypothetical protein n=1 Tax=Tsukamurella tyrosinosolvens TaxID=57704 RepID=UPI002DD42341|nr:hypothetical protein [Tsukamurella tyrosinosolvens]MEC4611813.1 hypothetical protein [Tsukamurella tyrosinosolvens]
MSLVANFLEVRENRARRSNRVIAWRMWRTLGSWLGAGDDDADNDGLVLKATRKTQPWLAELHDRAVVAHLSPHSALCPLCGFDEPGNATIETREWSGATDVRWHCPICGLTLKLTD